MRIALGANRTHTATHDRRRDMFFHKQELQFTSTPDNPSRTGR
ncbi:hypothetical protein [Brachybacterium sp. HMSC06H03]|nr:hypothetical protein [Brachybacterium sp. HMSC06H03]